MYPIQQPLTRLGVLLRTGVRLRVVRYRTFAAGFVEFVESDGGMDGQMHRVLDSTSCPVIVYTDHMAVKTVLKDRSGRTGRVARWLYRLQEYWIQFVHVPRRLQVVADGLSRMPHWEALNNGDEDGFPLPAFTVMTQDAAPSQSNWKLAGIKYSEKIKILKNGTEGQVTLHQG